MSCIGNAKKRCAAGAPRVLVSACLLGEPVRFDGAAKPSAAAVLQRWQAEGRGLGFCPERAGGLPVPRPAAEIQGPGGGAAVLVGAARVRTQAGADVTTAFVHGAQAALACVQAEGIRVAVLKEGSPSCGSGAVHAGRFDGQRVVGEGVTAALLRQAGVQVFSEAQWAQAEAALGPAGDQPPATMPSARGKASDSVGQ